FGHVGGRQVLAAQQGHGHVHDFAHIGIALERIEFQVRIQRGGGGHAVVVDQVGVPVGLGIGDVGGRQGAARARAVLDHNGLAQFFAELGAQRARQHVGGPASGKRHNQGDRTRRVVGGLGGRGQRKHDGRQGGGKG